MTKQTQVDDVLARFAAEAGLTGADSATANTLREIEDRQISGAFDLLEGSYEGEVVWPWRSLQELTFGPLAGEFWIVGARPSGGKTTFVLNFLQGLVAQERNTLFVGMETNPERLRIQWAAWHCGLPLAPILRKQWHLLPGNAREKLRAHLAWQQREDNRRRVTFADDERIDLKRLRHWLDVAADRDVQVVMLDHLHRMNWGGSVSEATARMAEGMVELKSLAKERNIRLVATAQLARPQRDVLEDYMPPSLSSIRQTGAAEQEADSVLFLHRTLKQGITEGDKMMVRQGLKPVAEVSEHGTMSVRVGKCRLDGDVRDQTVKLYVHSGRIFDDQLERDEFAFTTTHHRRVSTNG